MSETTETGYLESCCWTHERQHCPGAGCQCRCHARQERVTRREWEAIKIADFERLEAEVAHLQRFLMGAASDAHVLRRHPPYGSSFLDCNHTLCQEHRAALGLPLHGRGDPKGTPAAGEGEG